MLDFDARLELIKLYYKCGNSSGGALRAYKAAHWLRKDPFQISTISRLVQKFELHKTLHDIPKVGRPSLKEERKDNVENVMVALQAQNPFGHARTRTVSKCTGIPQRSVARIIRGLGLHPYKIRRLQNQQLIDRIMWSDEAYFSLDGVVTRHNCVMKTQTK